MSDNGQPRQDTAAGHVLRWSGRVVPLCCLAWVATSPAAASATAGGNR